MKTQFNACQLEFHALGRREVIGMFDGGNITSDAGGLLLRETEKKARIVHQSAQCFEDLRDSNQSKLPGTDNETMAKIRWIVYLEGLLRLENC
jgi:hypothetical protein